jgi:flavin reductase (DIM6/NTAB) family NADH-FMN oxidoreductase RutF
LTERARGGDSAPVAPSGWDSVLSAYAAGVTLVTIASGRDDIGTTVSAFSPVSLDPPLVLISLLATSYPAELLGADPGGGAGAPGDGPGPDAGARPGGRAAAGRFAVCLLAAGQRTLAGRFAAAGRPNARRMLDAVPHRRGALSGALIPEGGLAALECEVTQRVPAGDHVVLIARVLAVPYQAPSGDPLVRFRGRYPSLR